MKNFFVLLVASIASIEISAITPDQQQFNDNWLFTLNDSIQYSQSEYLDSSWTKLNLPHDWSREATPSPTLASCTGYLPGGIGWYRKHFNYTHNPSKPLTYIYFEGIYNRSEVYLNGHLIGSRPNGYISTQYDMTPWLKEGENTIAVRVDHSRYADSRWYTGSGIYRDVWIYNKPQRHIKLWGVSYDVNILNNNHAIVNIQVELEGEKTNKAQLIATLSDMNGKVVARKKTISKTDTTHISISVPNPHLWKLNDPYLYRLNIELTDGTRTVDIEQCPVGLRSISFDPDHGFALNGETMKIKGVCLHHDAGVLGAAVPPLLVKYRLNQLKKIGVNAIRCSHNPQAPVFYAYCDSLGLMVMDEASDEWEFPKRKWVKGWNVGEPSYDGTYDFFEEWIEQDITDMVRRDRVHPSIILWSVGNEVDYPNDPYSHPVLDGDSLGFTQPMFGGYNPQAPNAERIGLIADRLAKRIRAVDKSRPVTGALAGVVMSNCTIYPDVIDVVGYNYTESRYEQDHIQYPHRIIYGSENRSDYKSWTAVRDNEYISGQFIWTGADYLGESGRWPSRGLGTGLLDFSNELKPNGRFRQSLWNDTPVAYLGTHRMFMRGPRGMRRNFVSTNAPAIWNYDTGDTVRVVLYTNATTATLNLNGKQIGETKPWDNETGVIYWDIPYEPGTLTVSAVTSDNVVITDTIHTLTRPHHMKANVIARDATHAIVKLEVFDDNNNLCTLADNMVYCFVTGGKLIGLESGSNTDMSDYTSRQRRFYNGSILAYIELPREGAKKTLVNFRSQLLDQVQLTIE